MTCALAGRHTVRFPGIGHVATLGEGSIVHIHWEELSLHGCADEAAAMQRAADFAVVMSEYRRRGGRVALTLRNELPHSGRFAEAFLVLRRTLGRMADIVFVHDDGAAALARTQIGEGARLVVLPHPSSLDVYERRAALEAALSAVPSRTLLGFGAIRAQKGFDALIAGLPADFLRERDARLRISGRGPACESLAAAYGHRCDLHLDFRYVPDEKTPALLRTSAAVVLPYRRLLTSGVALLTLSFGGIVLARDSVAMRLLLPEAGHGLLFRPGDADDLRRAVDAVLSLGTRARRDLIADGLAIAEARHPRRISARLADHYDALLTARPDGPD